MARDVRVTVSSREFTVFINAINQVYRGGATLTIHKDYIDTLVLAEDNSSIMLYAKVNRLDCADTDEETVIHVRDMNKFQVLIDMNKENEFTFHVRNNQIYFESSKVTNAKFILDENPVRKIAKRVNVDWFNSFDKHFSITLKRSVIKEITSLARFASQSDKVYFYEKDGLIVAELNDREQMNIDNISVKVADEYTGHINGNIILALDSLSAISTACDDLLMEVIDVGRHEALFFTVTAGNVLIKYLFASKIK